MSTHMLRYCLLFTLITLGACAASPAQPPCAPDRQDIANCPPADAVRDLVLESQFNRRSRENFEALDIDPIKLGMMAEVPVNEVYGKIIGSSYEESINSLAAKIWLIDNAVYSVDFSTDLSTPFQNIEDGVLSGGETTTKRISVGGLTRIFLTVREE